jgi:hypothetical protein
LLLPLGQEALALVEGGFAFVQLAQLVGFLCLDSFLGLLVGVRGRGAGTAAAREEEGGAGERGGNGEELHTQYMGWEEERFNSI